MLQIRLSTSPFKGSLSKISHDKLSRLCRVGEAAGKDVYFQIPYQVTVACSKEEWLLIKRYADLNELSINDAAKKLIAGAAGKDLYRHPVRDARLRQSQDS